MKQHIRVSANPNDLVDHCDGWEFAVVRRIKTPKGERLVYEYTHKRLPGVTVSRGGINACIRAMVEGADALRENA